MAAVWCSFDSNLCSLIFYSCSLSSYLCYPLCLFPSTNIFCLYPPHSISRYFCKESLMTPPPPQHTSPLQVSLLLLLPLQKFSSYYFLHFPFVFICFPFVFTRVHSCSIRVHSCSLMFHSCSLVFHSCSLVFIRVPLVFIRVHSCSFVFTHVHLCSDLCGVLDMIVKTWSINFYRSHFETLGKEFSPKSTFRLLLDIGDHI